jgi:hypothetical protein
MWSGVLVSTLAGALIAQQPAGKGAGRGTGALPPRKAELAAGIANAAAAAQLASIRGSLGTMLMEVVAGSAGGDEDQELVSFQQDEILKAIALQLQAFVDQNKDMPAADGARALLARIYVAQDKTQDAVRVLQDFDAKAADKSDLLVAAMSVAKVAELAAKADEWLQLVAVDADGWDQRCDAVFVAARLGKLDLADSMLKQIRADAEVKAAKADVYLAEADLVARLAIRHIVPVHKPWDGGVFMVDPVVAAKLESNPDAAGSWRYVRKAGADQKAALDAAAKSKAETDDQFRDSKVYAQIVSDAAAGLRIMRQLKQVDADIAVEIDDRYVPVTDDKAPLVPPPADIVVKGLLFRVVHKHPGTDAAHKAAAKLEADTLVIGRRAVPFAGKTIDDAVAASADTVGKVVLLDFFAVANHDCVLERSKMKSLYDQYKAHDFEIVSVCLDVAADEWLVKSAIDAFDMDWKVVFDGKGPHSDIACRYGVLALPARILIGRDGRIVEDRAWKLTTDALDATVQAALRAPGKTPPLQDAAFLVEGRYLGPKIDVEIGPADADATKIKVEADCWVVDSAYKLTVQKVDTQVDATKVFLRLALPKQQKGQIDTEVVLEDRHASVLLPKANLRVVKIYVDHTSEDATVQWPVLLAMIPIDPNQIFYSGPKIEAELVSTDSIPPEYSLVLSADVPASQYSLKVDEIVRGKETTQVKLTILGPKTDALPVEDERARLFLPLGIDVAPTIQVLVSRLGDSGTPAGYMVAVQMPRE